MLNGRKNEVHDEVLDELEINVLMEIIHEIFMMVNAEIHQNQNLTQLLIHFHLL
jgi:hypothetical protein